MKKVLLLASLMVMAISAVSYAAPVNGEYITKTLFKDVNGNYHYVPSAEAKSIMKASDISKDGTWIVPNPGKMGFATRPVHEVMDMTEEEFDEWMRVGQGGDCESDSE